MTRGQSGNNSHSIQQGHVELDSVELERTCYALGVEHFRSGLATYLIHSSLVFQKRSTAVISESSQSSVITNPSMWQAVCAVLDSEKRPLIDLASGLNVTMRRVRNEARNS